MSRDFEKELRVAIKHDNRTAAVRGFMTLGGTLALVISWSLNKSILGGVLHGICSWFYVAYYAIFL